MKWYYVEQGQQTGPVSDEQLAELVRSGKINPGTLVWHEGLPEWRPYAQATGSGENFNANAGTPAAGSTSKTSEAVCAECGKIFPVDEMIRHGNARICANCKPVFMQKLAEGAQLNTGDLNYAGFWIRAGAKILDGLIIGVPMMVVYFILIFPIITSSRGSSTPPQLGALPFLLQFGMIFVNMAYQIFFLGKYGATLGKMACKIKVVNADGGKIGYGRAAGRFFAELLSGIICYIGYIIAGFDNPQKRALHDHICNTRVIYK
jgi:uncharacterized RDD family membrane protein YckC